MRLFAFVCRAPNANIIEIVMETWDDHSRLMRLNLFASVIFICAAADVTNFSIHCLENYPIANCCFDSIPTGPGVRCWQRSSVVLSSSMLITFDKQMLNSFVIFSTQAKKKKTRRWQAQTILLLVRLHTQPSLVGSRINRIWKMSCLSDFIKSIIVNRFHLLKLFCWNVFLHLRALSPLHSCVRSFCCWFSRFAADCRLRFTFYRSR